VTLGELRTHFQAVDKPSSTPLLEVVTLCYNLEPSSPNTVNRKETNMTTKQRDGEPTTVSTPERDTIKVRFLGEYDPQMHVIAHNWLERIDLEIVGFLIHSQPRLTSLVPSFDVILESDWRSTGQDFPVVAAGLLHEGFEKAGYKVDLLETTIKFFASSARWARLETRFQAA
jgi:hypothetical protein